MKNAMTRAHEIRKEAAAKWDCKVSEILFNFCLEMAWAEIKEDTMIKLKGSAKQVAWAGEIRTKLIETLNIMTQSEIEKFVFEYIKKQYTSDEIKSQIEKVKKVDSAIWWINQGKLTGTDVVITISNVDKRREYR